MGIEIIKFLMISPIRFVKRIYKFIFYRIQFAFIRTMRHTYFGPIFKAGQVWPERAPIMQDLINKELENSSNPLFKILEIGSWAGQSTILWATACKRKNKGIVYCIDTWTSSSNAPEIMKRAVKNNRIFNLFLYNIEVSGLKSCIVPLKGSSNIIAEILKPETFDFVYIDGDHAYTQFKKDLLNYMKFVKINGIICGDDLELNLDDVDVVNAKKYCESDYILDPKTKIFFHPGIALGIKEVFGSVSVRNGFWAIRKTKDGWVSIIL